jgi:site-specific recombinase XerD
VIAVCADGPKRGLEITIVGQSATQTLTVAERHKPPIDLAGRPNGPDDLVFTAALGGPIREHKLVERYFKPAAERAGLPAALRMHDLRHTAASLLIREGASIKALQRQLGHKDAVQTLNRYGHLYPDELDSLAERLERLYAAIDPAEVWPQGGPAVVQIGKAAGQ